ncbi:hypothetical protein OE88DRAFT_426272 [Heliocybe sulcata]|uniref:Uncharacterized protein n=1 Tax=Heliocybe sulcata TaxID=5364 RepID=A0A5C3MVT4_9AGAM|nr:hypothetical protein OE88DRAFT_426272 [Heliocybe sulcata]
MTVENGGTTTWHTIRPWSPPSLTLTTREITSVSATFVLSTCDWNSQIKSLSETFRVADEESDDEDGARTPIAETLSKGLSVKVNSAPWQRVLIRVDERADEAVVIVYGLLPGRGYEIELGVIHDIPEAGLEGVAEEAIGREERIRRDVVTEGVEHIHTEGLDDTQSSSDLFSPSDPPSPSSSLNSLSSPPPRPTITIEQYTNTLLARLTALNNERNEILATLKTSRKESQKADSTLRSEIDILKRSSERFSKEESRAKQKLLQLQETVKRTGTVTEEIDETTKEVQAEVPELELERQRKDKEFERVKAEADKVQARREEVESDARKREEALKAELAREEARLEKLGTRKERLEGGVAELEEKLDEVRREMERVESEEYPLDEDVGEQLDPAVGERTNGNTHESNIAPGQSMQVQKKRHPHYPHPRSNFFGGRGHQHQHQGIAPIQRPHQQPGSPFHNHYPNHHHHFGAHQHNRNPAPHGPKGQGRSTTAGSSSSGSSGSSPHISAATANSSGASTAMGATTPITILSSRAPPFEPSSARYSNRSSTYPALSASNSQGHGQTQSLSQFQTPSTSTSELNPASAPFTPRMAHLARATAGDPATGTQNLS